jgi:hypothetical protein
MMTSSLQESFASRGSSSYPSSSSSSPSSFNTFSWWEYIVTGFWEEYGDDYAQGYYVVDGGPWRIVAIVAAYLLFVKVIGPRFMKNRPPYDLKNVLYYYNLIHVVGNGLCSIVALYITRMTFDCWKSTRTGDPNNVHHTILLYLSLTYFCAKFLDLFDTVFFVLRKKDKQVSFLHVVHHSVMPLCTYVALRFAPIGRTSIIGIINSVVHTVMYTYYFMSAIPSMQQHLWWKKYITQMQIVQFIIFLTHSLQGIFLINHNDFPLGVSILELLNAMFFLKSFIDFFITTYKKPVEPKLKSSDMNNASHVASSQTMQERLKPPNEEKVKSL